jgi:2-oxo-3-hexenedioate decarboxylase/2-keto-4-pentenoate hydratase
MVFEILRHGLPPIGLPTQIVGPNYEDGWPPEARVVNLVHMDADALDRAAVMIAATRAGVGRLAPLPAGLAPRDEAEAYAIQDRLRLHLAGRGLGGLAGFKIGCTTQVMQKYLGIDHPCAGAMSSDRIYASGSVFPAAAFVRPGVECEIAVEIARDLMPADAPFDRAGLSDAIAAVFAAIEIVDDRYKNWRAMDLATLVADDFFHAGLVLGPRVADWQGLDLARLRGTLRVDGVAAGHGCGSDILGHPLKALAWLANHRAARGLGLRAGDLVSLGSVTETRWLVPGQSAEIEIEKLGAVTLRYGA